MESSLHYNGTVELLFDPAKHYYTINGEKARGVTTVLQRLNKPALVYWSASMAAKHIEATLQPGQSLDEMEIKRLAKDALWAHRNTKDDAAELGTFVHQWIQDYVEGKSPNDPINPKLLKAITAFKDWYKNLNITDMQCEKKLCSPTLGLAGTVDLICKLDGKLTIIDWKSGSGIYPEYLYQMGAYSAMYEEEFGEKVEQIGVVNCSVKTSFSTYFTDSVDQMKSIYRDILELDSKLTKVEMEMK